MGTETRRGAQVRPQRYLRITELAERWSISVAHAYRIAGTVLPAMRIGGSVRVPLDAVEQYEKAQLGRIPGEARAAS